MTDTERAEINKTLARAMGWDFIPHASEIVNALEPDRGEWFTPSGKLYGDAPPDFTRDPAASRELLEWLRIQCDAVKDIFGNQLLLSLRETQDAAKSGDGIFWGDEILAVLASPLETVALAAVQAIGGNAE